MNNKQRRPHLKWPIIIFVAAGFFYLKESEHPLVKNLIPVSKPVQENYEIPAIATLTKKASPSFRQAPAAPLSKPNFVQQAKRYFKKIERYPETKNELIQFLIAENPQLNYEPHTAEEDSYNKNGALKVFVLTELLKQIKERENQIQVLEQIMDEAEDPTIKAISKKARDLALQNRDLFKELPKAILKMKVPR